MLKYILTEFRLIALLAALTWVSGQAAAQSLFDEMLVEGDTVSVPADMGDGKVILPGMTLPTDTTIMVEDMMYTETFFLPVVFDHLDIFLKEKAGNILTDSMPSAEGPMAFFDRVVLRDYRQRYFLQHLMGERPWVARYSMSKMPRPPKKFVMKLDPSHAKLTVEEFKEAPLDTMKKVVPGNDINHIYWLHTFDGSLQFSQAYISPNWYQGGKSSLNAIGFVQYNVKLNNKFHPNVIFDSTVSYKLGLNNAPDDTIHKYNISEDILQLNSRVGFKAFRKWFWSMTLQFKTQVLNSYRVNTNDLVAAFMSPGQFNLGIGMTYNHENRRRTFSAAVSLAPFSYNLKTCTNPDLNPVSFGIDEGKTSKSEFGSSVEVNLRWNITYNISYNSRLFAFSDYHYLQGDWQHTIDFSINKYMSARIFANLRYDTLAPERDDTKWHKWMFKEILSIGFNYRFSPI